MNKYILIILTTLIAACGGNQGKLTVALDGSSTVFPISEAVAEEFGKVNPKVRVTVGVSGTGGGFKKYLAGEIDINNASRHIKSKEIKKAAQNNVDFIEIPVAFDGLSVVINKNNTWVDYLTDKELKQIWQPDSTVTRWSEVRKGWPNTKISLFGPGTDSGTFDYFTKAINGKEGASRSDYTASEDDNTLVQGVSGEKGALGYFGYAYYIANKDKIKVVPIKNTKKYGAKAKAILPTLATINNGSYSPLSRPVFIYVNPQSLARPEVTEFINFYLTNAANLSQEVGYIALPSKVYKKALAKITNKITGTAYTQNKEFFAKNILN